MTRTHALPQIEESTTNPTRTAKKYLGIRKRRLIPRDEETPDISVVFKKAQEHGFPISAKARGLVLRSLKLGREEGTLETADEEALGAAAMVAAAIEKARERHNTCIFATDVRAGWKTYVGYGGNHKPHKCFRRSVLQRTEQLERTLPYFATLSKGGR
jgi:hypothetical protein